METIEKKEVKTWNLDPSHSSVHFAVKHMVISQTKGVFQNYRLNVESNGLEFTDATIELEIDVNSINTNSSDMDNHLRSADFFDAEKFPMIHFISTSMTKVNDEDYVLKGDLTIKDITKPIEFKVSYGGQLLDPWGNIRAGFTLESSVDRFDYGLTWNALLEAGGAMVGKSVKLMAEIEVVTPK
ncbi:MAG: polyisoprenoid-binding protein [Bacteroidetes bacterium]|jgi:polyisoprenoid-binding protein YceI|nr:polyisoprenoid-binding protein [Bacteroidota bacterium]